MIQMNTLRRAALAVVAATLAGCGGGSGGSGGGDGIVAPTAPVLSLVPQRIKTFRFSWGDVRGESEYRLLEDADGTSGYTTVATIAANQTSYDLAVFLPERVNARYVLQACNRFGCADSAPAAVTGSLANAVGYLKASNTGRLDLFGSAIALSGDGSTLAVAALTEASSATGVNGNQTDDSAVQSGAVYVFTHTGTEWRQQAYVKASNTGHTDLFGSSVSLSGDGDTLVVGAPYEDSDATGINGDQTNNLASGSGAVYVFSRTGTDWHQQAYLKASITLIDHRFGARVRLSDDGNTLAIAADGSRPGQYVYSRNGSEWRHRQLLHCANGCFRHAALSRDGQHPGGRKHI